MISDKNVLRKKYSALRIKEKSADKDISIFRRLTELPEFINADSVYLYYSVGSEVDTLRLIDFCIESGKRVALPKCTDKEGNMMFYFIESTDVSLTSGAFGIMEPDINKCKKAYASENSVCIVPGISFDISGYRLGYGKGYYDRFLKDFSGTAIGLCYEGCLCEELPKDIYDRKVSRLITENKNYFFE